MTQNPGKQKMVSPFRMPLTTIQDPLGSDGKKEKGTWDIRSLIKEKLFNAPTSITGWCTESHMKWEQKGVGSNNLLERCMHVLNSLSKPWESAMITLKSSLKMCHSTLLPNKHWNNLTIQEHWPRWPDLGCSAHASQSMPNLCRQCKTCPVQCISSTSSSITKPDSWSSS